MSTGPVGNEIKAFVTWKFGGVAFLAVPAFSGDGQNVIILDENGGAYGQWMSVDRFRTLQIRKESTAQPMGCVASLKVSISQGNMHRTPGDH